MKRNEITFLVVTALLLQAIALQGCSKKSTPAAAAAAAAAGSKTSSESSCASSTGTIFFPTVTPDGC